VKAHASVFVVVPAYAEEERIARVLGRLPSFIDGVVVVDDHSPDETANAVRAVVDSRVHLVRHAENRGVGRSIASGYQRALELGADVLVVMAGDDQMDPADLDALIAPIVEGRADYVKGNRLRHSEVARMPMHRRWGTRALGWLTARASGLALGDSQCGYTALARQAALDIDWNELWERYGYPNDLLILLGRRGARVHEVTVRPVYAGEKSGLRPWHLLTIVWVIARRFALETSLVTAQRARRQAALSADQPLLSEQPAQALAGEPERAVTHRTFAG